MLVQDKSSNQIYPYSQENWSLCWLNCIPRSYSTVAGSIYYGGYLQWCCTSDSFIVRDTTTPTSFFWPHYLLATKEGCFSKDRARCQLEDRLLFFDQASNAASQLLGLSPHRSCTMPHVRIRTIFSTVLSCRTRLASISVRASLGKNRPE